MRIRTPLLVIAAAATMLAGAALPALAADGDTATTFELASGEIAMTVPAPVSLTPTQTNAYTDDASVSGSLGSTKVTDNQGNEGGTWNVSAYSSDFTSDGTPVIINAANVSYAVTALTAHTGTVLVGFPGSTDMTEAADNVVVAATDVVGNNTATFNPTITVALPTTGLHTGVYSGTVSQSVV